MLPFLDLKGYARTDLPQDLLSAVVLAFLSIPQGIAYALVAGLPPAAGLYAGAIPAIIGGFMRSSRHVITGPSNAISLIVGSTVAAHAGADPSEVAIVLAIIVGVVQVAGGVLKLNSIVDYISGPVVLGYITGAATLIFVGQLPSATHTLAENGNIGHRIFSWMEGVHAAHMPSVVFTLGAVLVLLLLRKFAPKLPAALVLMLGGILVVYVFDLRSIGIELVADKSPIPPGLPPLTLPNLSLAPELVPAALACAVLSLVESTSVARSIALKSGQHIHTAAEFTGQGIANISAAFCGAYPTSGSLARSALNFQLGTPSRIGGALSGLVVLLVVAFMAKVVDLTPIAALSGLLFVLVFDLIDIRRIRKMIVATKSDAMAFFVTLLGTWFFSLDEAIYLGVFISLVMFLRRSRLLRVREMVSTEDIGFRDLPIATEPPERACPTIRMIHIEGPFFFAAAAELHTAMQEILLSKTLKVVVLRMRRVVGMDATAASALITMGESMRASGRHLILSGVNRPDQGILERLDALSVIDVQNIFPSSGDWLSAHTKALKRALELVDKEHGCDASCPIRERVRARMSSTPQPTLPATSKVPT